MASMSVSGVISGMDWDSMIDEIITNAAKPAQVKVNKKTNLTNKKSLFEEMKVTMNSLQSSLSPLKLPSTYKAKEINIERVDTSGSYKGVLTATANADAEVNVWDVKVNNLATAQINRSKQITSSTLSSTLNGLSSSTFYVNMGGQKVGIEVNATDTLQALKSRINNTLKTLDNPLAVTASVVDNKLILKSDDSGLGTRTATETINYSSSGINRLSNISVNDSDAGNLKITKGSTSYTYGTDFTVANGNEIRWKQYDRSTEVALNDTVNVKYRMAAGDVYESKGTYGSNEAEISGFSMIDNGTLASRLKIKDSAGNTYTYGKDFTITNNKVVWLDEEESTTNEPDSYTVSYTKTEQKTYTASGTKASPTSTPASYTVQYTKEVVPSTSITYGRNDSTYSFIGISAGSLDTFSEMTAIDGVSSVTGGSNTYLTFDDDSEPTININGTDYVYGRDYVIRKGSSTDQMFFIPYTSYTSEINNYLTAAGKTMPDGVQLSPQADIIAHNPGTFSYTHTTSIDSTDTASISALLNDSSTDTSNIVILKSDGTQYTEGTDYHISNGEIVWTLPNDTTDITMSQFADLQTQYAEAAGTELSTVTLIDGNGVLRTYVDPADASLFTMSAGGVDYEYGRDYVLRVNDAGTGYRFDWLIEGSNTITDANTAVATYAAHKNISTSSWQAAPAEDTAYTFGFTYDSTTTETNTVSKTASDKSLATVLSGVTIDSSDYPTAITISDGTKTYTYGTDYTIDGSGNITWIEQSTSTYTPQYPDDGATYTLSYEAFTAITATDTTDGSTTQEVSITVDSGYGNYGGNKRSYEQILSDTGLTSSSSNDDWAKYFTLTDGTTTYTYGTDYTIIQGDDTDSDTGEHNVMINWINAPASGTSFTLSYGGDSGEVLTTKGVKRSATDTITGSPLATDFDGGTNTITYSGKTFYEGVDFNITEDSDGYAAVTWISDSNGGTEWFYPDSGAYYTLNHTDDDGNTISYNAWRTSSATLSMADYGMTTANGSLTVQYGDKLGLLLDANSQYDDDGNAIADTDGHAAIRAEYSIDISDSGNGNYNFRWVQPTLTSRSGLPSLGDELTVEYEYDANTFTITGEAADLLGLNDDVTEAQDAELVVDGQTVYRASNDIGADYDNELIKGVTMHLKGVGEVSLDIEHDAEKAVESIQSFVDTYNELMSWMNTRMSEKQLDKDTKATVDSDDFRMRWGLLHGNSLLRNTKSQMRSLVSQNFTFSFTQRASSSEIYGTMAHNGLKSSSTLRLRIGTKYVDVAIDPTDTLQTIVAKINDDTKGGPMNDIYYDENGNKLQTPLLRASADNDVLTINSTSSDEITMSGSAAMNVLKMNYTYKGLYQIGIETTSDDYGKSGELVFDANEFMTALEDNPDEVQALMLKFVDSFGSWTKSMLNSSASGETSGTLTREIENIQTQIDSINEYLETYQERLDRMEENLRTRYGNTETQFAKLSQQANSISAILNQLNGTAQGGGYGQTSS